MPATLSQRLLPRLTLAAILTALAASFGCNSNVDEKLALAALAQTCLVNSDCKSPLVCAFEACHAECESSRDCDAGARCVAAARPYKVCQLEEERACERAADCAEGLVCGVDGECRDRCVTDTDCVEGQVCSAGTCADSGELDDSGQLPVAPGMARGTEGAPCAYVSDCAAALLCRDRACLPECRGDRDCPLGTVCSDTRCIDDGSAPAACAYSSECDSERGERCLAGACRCLCVEDRDCAEGQICNGCGCEADPSAPQTCIYNSDCDGPGEVCRNRECACECRTDDDCSEGLSCDGCGCFDPQTPADGIVRGDVTIESSLQLPLYAGTTEILGDLFITGSAIPDLGTTFDRLERVGRVTINTNSQLTRLAFPRLREAQWFSVSNLSALSELDVPALETASLALGSLERLTSLRFDSLQSGLLQISAMPQLSELRLPRATTLTEVLLAELPALEELSLPELTHLSGAVSIQAQSEVSALRSLSAPKLSSVDVIYLRINHTRLTTLDDFGGSSWTVKSNDLQIMDNPELSDCEIAELVARFEAGGYAGTATVSGNLPCPSCQGASCPN